MLPPSANCPSCKEKITTAKIQHINLKDGLKNIDGVVYTCPKCNAAISMGIDPELLAKRIAALVKKRI